MTNFGEWVKQAQSFRVGLGVAVLALTAVVSLLSAAMNAYKVPGRLVTLEASTSALTVSWASTSPRTRPPRRVSSAWWLLWLKAMDDSSIHSTPVGETDGEES